VAVMVALLTRLVPAVLPAITGTVTSTTSPPIQLTLAPRSHVISGLVFGVMTHAARKHRRTRQENVARLLSTSVAYGDAMEGLHGNV
jgi:VanZ family protein